MNIIRLCPIYHPYVSYGGSVIADIELDKAMVSQKHSILVITCRMPGDKFTEREISSGHKVRYFSAVGKIPYGVSAGALYSLFINCLKNRKKIDLVWFGGVWNLLSVLGPLICRMFSVNYVITPHGMLIRRLIKLRTSTLKKIVINMFLKSNLENAYRVHFTVSREYIETQEATEAHMRPVIFPLCLDLKKFDGHHKTHYQDKIEGRVTLSFIGRITPKKRIDLIFAALKVLPAETKAKLIFQVVGTDNEGLWNKEEYTEEEIGVPIMYRGPLYDNELFNAYHKTDVFILCSESENFAISVVEAAYCYCVPFISKEVGVSEYFSEESAVYADLDELDICQKLDHLIRNPEELAKYKLEARKVSEQFDSSLLPDGYFKELLK